MLSHPMSRIILLAFCCLLSLSAAAQYPNRPVTMLIGYPSGGLVDIVARLIAEGMKPTLAGIALGAFGAYMLSGVLSKLVYGVSASDPLTFLVVAVLLAAVALVACAIPGYRATRVQPVQALRSE